MRDYSILAGIEKEFITSAFNEFEAPGIHYNLDPTAQFGRFPTLFTIVEKDQAKEHPYSYIYSYALLLWINPGYAIS